MTRIRILIRLHLVHGLVTHQIASWIEGLRRSLRFLSPALHLGDLNVQLMDCQIEHDV